MHGCEDTLIHTLPILFVIVQVRTPLLPPPLNTHIYICRCADMHTHTLATMAMPMLYWVGWCG